MDIYDIRFGNYKKLLAEFEEKEMRNGVAQHGVYKRFAIFVGISPAYISHLNSRIKGIGDQSAAQMEAAFKKPKGWMDTDHSSGVGALGLAEAEYVKLALKLFRESPLEAQTLLIRHLADRPSSTASKKGGTEK